MTDEYKDYLAGRILSENQPATYRLLSRALKVNVHTAKQMLYEFHTQENKKKPNSVHATYLITGLERDENPSDSEDEDDGDDDDVVMASSPPASSMPDPEMDVDVDVEKEEGEDDSEESYDSDEDPGPVTSVMLVKEEDLEETKAGFKEITSLHIYSLEPTPIEDFDLLTVCNREAKKESRNDDPLERWRLYGSIHNPYIKAGRPLPSFRAISLIPLQRRTGKYVPPSVPAPAKPAPKVATKFTQGATKLPSKSTAAPAPATGTKRASPPGDISSGKSTPQAASTTSTAKKPASKDDFFKAFAKAKPKPKEAEKPAPAFVEDVPMHGMSEDEGEEYEAPAVKFDEEKAKKAREARAAREEALRKMMEESDEEMPDVADPSPVEEESQDAVEEEAPAATTAGAAPGGKRRGRRRVMKKKKVQDEDGYLVTKEEMVWESFSEDEQPEPKKAKPTPKPAPAAKGKKTGKMGQGSIASFFKKA